MRGILTAYGGRAAIDEIGIGAGVYDGLREEKFDVSAFNAAERDPSERDLAAQQAAMDK